MLRNNFKPCSAEKQDSTLSIHDVETKDVTLIFKSDETMDRPSLDPDIHLFPIERFLFTI
jgi:hypothetical protein